MKKNGFSLTELMVTLVIMSIITIMVVGTFIYQQKMMNKEGTISDLNIKARKVSSYIVNEIRKIGLSRLPLTSTTMFGIVNGSKDSLEYTYDSQNGRPGIVDVSTDVHSIKVRNDTLYIDNYPALSGVSSIVFQYLDTKGNIISQLPVKEVDLNGNSVLGAGQLPVNRIKFTVYIHSPNKKEQVHYTDVCSIRNIK